MPGYLVMLRPMQTGTKLELRNVSFDDDDVARPYSNNDRVRMYQSDIMLVITSIFNKYEGEDVLVFTTKGTGWIRLSCLQRL